MFLLNFLCNLIMYLETNIKKKIANFHVNMNYLYLICL